MIVLNHRRAVLFFGSDVDATILVCERVPCGVWWGAWFHDELDVEPMLLRGTQVSADTLIIRDCHNCPRIVAHGAP